MYFYIQSQELGEKCFGCNNDLTKHRYYFHRINRKLVKYSQAIGAMVGLAAPNVVVTVFATGAVKIFPGAE